MDLGRAWTLETDDEPDEGAPHLSAKSLRLCGYVLAAFFVAVVLDGPAPLRLPLSLAMVLAVPGLTLVGPDAGRGPCDVRVARRRREPRAAVDARRLCPRRLPFALRRRGQRSRWSRSALPVSSSRARRSLLGGAVTAILIRPEETGPAGAGRARTAGWPLLCTLAAVGLWLASLPSIDARQSGELGLIHELPATFWVGRRAARRWLRRQTFARRCSRSLAARTGGRAHRHAVRDRVGRRGLRSGRHLVHARRAHRLPGAKTAASTGTSTLGCRGRGHWGSGAMLTQLGGTGDRADLRALGPPWSSTCSTWRPCS